MSGSGGGGPGRPGVVDGGFDEGWSGNWKKGFLGKRGG